MGVGFDQPKEKPLSLLTIDYVISLDYFIIYLLDSFNLGIATHMNIGWFFPISHSSKA